jgi:hypothetical protein
MFAVSRSWQEILLGNPQWQVEPREEHSAHIYEEAQHLMNNNGRHTVRFLLSNVVKPGEGRRPLAYNTSTFKVSAVLVSGSLFLIISGSFDSSPRTRNKINTTRVHTSDRKNKNRTKTGQKHTTPGIPQSSPT